MHAIKMPGGVTRWVKDDPAPQAVEAIPPTLRHHLGAVLRELRLARGATLRCVSGEAKIALGYLSEVERGIKEPSSEILNNLCDALGITLATLLRIVAERLEPTPADQIQVPDTVAQILELSSSK